MHYRQIICSIFADLKGNEHSVNKKEKIETMADNTNNAKNNNGAPNNKPFKFNFLWIIYAPLLFFILYSLFNYKGGDPVKTEWSIVKERIIPSGDVEKITFISNQDKGEVVIKRDSLSKYSSLFGGRVPDYSPHSAQLYFCVSRSFEPEVQLDEARSVLPAEKRFTLAVEQRTSYWSRIFDWLLPVILLLFLWSFMFRRIPGGGALGGGIFSVGKSQAKVFDKNNKSRITFKDVAGLEEAKVEVMEIVDFLKNPKKYTNLGGKIPKGALLIGPPGTGKTLLAKAVAGEANVPFFSLSGSDFVEMFVGVGASRVRDLFKQAKEKAPCIVFIDEIDAVGRARSKNAGLAANDERENTLNQLLTEMDGFGTNSGVIVLAATNRADILDKALMRAGRFDRQINIDLPELKDREQIFKVHLSKLKMQPDFDTQFLAKQTPGFSGADIANVCNEAALIAARHDKTTVERQDFLDAIDRIIGGLEKKSKIIPAAEKKTIAYHEAGHATVSWFLPNANPLLKVTIIPRGKALGAAWYMPEERQIMTKEQMMDEMASLIGGRVAEELIIKKISSGALNDLERLTKMAYSMVTYYGMSEKVGNVSYYNFQEDGYSFAKPYSEKLAELLDVESKKLIDKAKEMAIKVLEDHHEGFTELAELLLEKEVIFAEDLERIFGPRVKQEPDTIKNDKELEKDATKE